MCEKRRMVNTLMAPHTLRAELEGVMPYLVETLAHRASRASLMSVTVAPKTPLRRPLLVHCSPMTPRRSGLVTVRRSAHLGRQLVIETES